MAEVDEVLTKTPKPDPKYPRVFNRTVRHYTNSAMVNVARPDTHEQARIWPDGKVEVLSPRRRGHSPFIQRVEDGQRVYLWLDPYGKIETLKERRAL